MFDERENVGINFCNFQEVSAKFSVDCPESFKFILTKPRLQLRTYE